MPLLFSKIPPALSTAWSLWSGSTCTDLGEEIAEDEEDSYLFVVSNWKWPLWTLVQNCLPYVLNAGFSASIEKNEWKAYHAQVRRHGRRTNTKRSKRTIINMHWWRCQQAGQKGTIGTETSARSRNWNAVRQQLGNLAAEVHSSSLSRARPAERMTSCCRFPC